MNKEHNIRERCEREAREIINEADTSPNYSRIEDLIALAICRREEQIEQHKSWNENHTKRIVELSEKIKNMTEELEFLRDKYKVASYESAIKVLTSELETEKEKYQEMVRTNEYHVQKLKEIKEHNEIKGGKNENR